MCRICLYSSCAVIHALTNGCFVTYFVLIGLLASFMGAAWFLIFFMGTNRINLAVLQIP